MASRRQLDHKIWGIAWPAILSNISVPLLGLVDAAILGHLGSTHYLGAVAIGSALLSFLYWGFSFLRMGTTGLVAKAVGAGELDRAVLVLAQSGVLALVLAVAVIALHPLWLQLGFLLMAPQAELLPLANSYATIRIFSAPAVLVTYTIVGWFIGRQNTRWPMLIMVSTNAANIALDFLFIIGLGLNSDGAALATLVAEYLGCSLALYAAWHSLPQAPGRDLYRRLLSLPAYRDLLRSNRHLFLRTVTLLFSFAFFTAMGDKLGADTLAANTLMMQLVFLAAFGMDGFAFAAEGLAGTALGARDLEKFGAVVRRCSFWCGLSAGVLSLLFLLGHIPLFALLTSIPEVNAIMLQHRAWLIALPLVAAPSYLLDGVFIGSAETRYMMTTMLFSTLCIYLPVWYLTRGWGNHGLWLAFTAFNAARGITLYHYFQRLGRSGGWLPASGGNTQ
ncbi:MAG: MATE family efflux transporter [Haliea sp.]|jgi:MATE family multidrug resistance protein|nr:MATE family efflux transporter [Haliea sp.]